jgi:hypothetical protein
MGALVALVVILAFYAVKCRAKAKGTFIPTSNNLTLGSNNPMWWNGSADAGHGGSLHRDLTEVHAAHHAGLCPSGMSAATYQDADGATLTRCVPGRVAPDLSTCKAGWDPAAMAEAQALATVGSFQQDNYGERALQSAINVAYDSNTGLSDVQLQELMHQGGAS